MAKWITLTVECPIDVNQIGGTESVINLAGARTRGLDVTATARADKVIE
jgi:hypothetical protein